MLYSNSVTLSAPPPHVLQIRRALVAKRCLKRELCKRPPLVWYFDEAQMDPHVKHHVLIWLHAPRWLVAQTCDVLLTFARDRMDWTDVHYRQLARLMTRHTVLYTEMYVDQTLLHSTNLDR